MFGHDDHDEDKPQDDNQHGDHTSADDITKSTTTDGANDWQHPGPPPSDGNSDDDTEDDQLTGSPEPSAEPSTDHITTGSADNDLIDLKREALTKLSPLVDHLDQAPDEKFRTLMMMIQASDNQRLVKQAYDTALGIDDEKERAQALLDIINEINYFTQSPSKPE